jgi:hypothetical protein
MIREARDWVMGRVWRRRGGREAGWTFTARPYAHQYADREKQGKNEKATDRSA